MPFFPVFFLTTCSQYTDLAKEPAFDLKTARQDHVDRKRETELERSKAAFAAWVEGGKKKPKRAKATKANVKAADNDEEGSATWDSEDEAEEHAKDVIHKNFRQEDEEEASFEGGNIKVDQRPKSKRTAKPRNALKAFICEEDEPSSPELVPDSVKPSKKRAAVTVAVAPAANRSNASAASARSAVPVTARAVSRKRGRKPAIDAVAEAEMHGKVVTAAASGPALVHPVSAPPRKRRLELDVAAEEESPAAVVAREMAIEDAAVAAEAVGLVGEDPKEIEKRLIRPLAHVSNTIVDDYVRLLLKDYSGLAWPSGMLVETTGRWVQFETDVKTDQKVVDGIFARNHRLVGITQLLWPMYGNDHFALLVIDVEKRTIRLLDSIIGFKWNLSWLQGLLRRAFGWAKNPVVKVEKCRQQGNGHDCGVYVMANLRSFVERVDFNAVRMPGRHLGEGKAMAVLAVRSHLASELLEAKVIPWK